jgi:hypothetical protein
VGVHHDQLRVAEPGLGDAALDRRLALRLGHVAHDPTGFVRDLAARVVEKLAAYDDAYALTTIAGGMRLEEYLRTRTFELVVHGFDIAAACGVDPDVASEPLIDAATLAAEVAVRAGRGPALLMALTGRSRLPEPFSIV